MNKDRGSLGELVDLLIHPVFLVKSILHIMAMSWPSPGIKVHFYRLRGTRIGENVQISPRVFLEERYAQLISIGDNVQIGPGVIITTHDSSNKLISWDLPIQTGEVIIGHNSYIGAGAIILPGVSIGDNVIIGAGSLVNKSIPPNTVAVGVPARVICSMDEWKSRHGRDSRSSVK